MVEQEAVAEPVAERSPERGQRLFYAVVRESDGHVLALCEEIIDAARAVVRYSRKFGDVCIREATADLSITFTGRRPRTS